jgi:hypothetical protein
LAAGRQNIPVDLHEDDLKSSPEQPHTGSGEPATNGVESQPSKPSPKTTSPADATSDDSAPEPPVASTEEPGAGSCLTIPTSDSTDTDPIEALPPSEQKNLRKELHRCENVIKQTLKAWQEGAKALTRIRDLRLYRAEGFKDFEKYCKQRLNFGKSTINRYIALGEVYALLAPTGAILPSTERQMRPLLRLRQAEEEPAVWGKAVKEVWAKVVHDTDILKIPITEKRVQEARSQLGLDPKPEEGQPEADLEEQWIRLKARLEVERNRWPFEHRRKLRVHIAGLIAGWEDDDGDPKRADSLNAPETINGADQPESAGRPELAAAPSGIISVDFASVTETNGPMASKSLEAPNVEQQDVPQVDGATPGEVVDNENEGSAANLNSARRTETTSAEVSAVPASATASTAVANEKPAKVEKPQSRRKTPSTTIGDHLSNAHDGLGAITAELRARRERYNPAASAEHGKRFAKLKLAIAALETATQRLSNIVASLGQPGVGSGADPGSISEQPFSTDLALKGRNFTRFHRFQRINEIMTAVAKSIPASGRGIAIDLANLAGELERAKWLDIIG